MPSTVSPTRFTSAAVIISIKQVRRGNKFAKFYRKLESCPVELHKLVADLGKSI